MAINGDVSRVEPSGLTQTVWRIDPSRSSVEFQVPHAWGLAKVKGQFDRYEGTLDLRSEPAIELTVNADSINTKNEKRDKHLRSDDFFGVQAHPLVHFTSDSATLDDEHLTIMGTLRAAGANEPLQLVATLRPVDQELEIEATANVDQRRLGMTFNFVGMIRTPAKLVVRGRLVRDT
jgi:polyisoprenoid-binding protein YceI